MNRLIIACILLIVLSPACKTASSVKIMSSDIAGLWIGTHNAETLPGQEPLFYSLVIFPDGSILTKGMVPGNRYYYAAGTWKITDNNKFSAIITTITTPAGAPVTQSISAIVNRDGTMENAIWSDTYNPNGKGHHGRYPVMNKVN